MCHNELTHEFENWIQSRFGGHPARYFRCRAGFDGTADGAGGDQARCGVENIFYAHAGRFAGGRGGSGRCRLEPIWRAAGTQRKGHRIFSHRQSRRPLVASGSRWLFVPQRRRGRGEDDSHARGARGAGGEVWQRIKLGMESRCLF